MMASANKGEHESDRCDCAAERTLGQARLCGLLTCGACGTSEHHVAGAGADSAGLRCSGSASSSSSSRLVMRSRGTHWLGMHE